MNWIETRKIIIIVVGAILNAIAMNFFLIPANVYASGFTGVAQLFSSILNGAVSTGILLFILNVPIAIFAWKRVGKLFTLYSFLSVVITTVSMEIIPVISVSKDILLNAVFGGVIAAVGVGITLKWGASTGGMDIIAMYLSKAKDRPVGTYFFSLNAVIIITAGFLFGWEKALYTLVTLYASTRVIDAIHTRHEKLTAMIITNKQDEMKKAIHNKLVRGITMIPARGAFSNEHREMLMIVVSRYELFDLQRTIQEVDPNAFTNIVNTADVYGVFRRD
ncbi:YitT family protein [Cytobacillus kochii]|uniref:YitT family protein n=1 Tax=Cytobacillus kochii TaxID=859143 RepID=UPI00203E520A|nr:YitT family protein [Cytobacillus kochii]MCM3322053.1 YitT family protein [Cytobacillus kochii]MCM3343115.1 YitT family protein [Cytobacillus kochii]